MFRVIKRMFDHGWETYFLILWKWIKMIIKIFLKFFFFYQKYEEGYDIFFSAAISCSLLFSFFTGFVCLLCICLFKLFPNGLNGQYLGGTYLFFLIFYMVYFYRMKPTLNNEITNHRHINKKGEGYINLIILGLFISIFSTFYLMNLCGMS